MNIFQRVTIESLKKNKTRTVVTIIGIILSAAMICAVTTLVSSVYNYALENAIYVDGDWHASALDTEYKTYEDIWNTGDIEDAVYAQQLGYALMPECNNEYKPYLFVLGVSNDFDEMMPIHMIEGTYPTSADEILLPEHLEMNGGVAYELGDTITVELGNRVSDGFTLGQNNPFVPEEDGGEEIDVRESRSYKVVGFYERPTFEGYSAPGYTAITMMDKEWDSSYLFNVWFKMENPRDTYQFIEKHQITGEANNGVLMYSGVSQFDRLDAMLTSLATIIIGLIMFGSISLIYNAFAISVSERTKQFGLLSSIGATKKQLRKMVFFEATVVSVIGIPLGILAGVGGIGVTLMLIGDKFQSWINAPISLHVSVSPLSIVIAVLIAFATVMISAWIPSKRATKITAVEAIRQSRDISTNKKPIKTSKVMYKLFGLPGMLANKYYKRSKKKYRATVISLFMSIVLFVSASAFTDYLMESVSGGFDTRGYDLRYLCMAEDFEEMSKEELLQLIKEDKAVSNASYIVSRYMSGVIDKSYLTEKVAENPESLGASQENVGASQANIQVGLTFVNDEAFRELLQEYNLSEDKFMNPESPLAIVVDGNTLYDYTEEKYVKMNVLNSDESEIVCQVNKDIKGYYFGGKSYKEDGSEVYVYHSRENDDMLEIPVEEAQVEVTLQSGKTIYEMPYFVDLVSSISYIYPESAMSQVAGNMDAANYTHKLLIASENHSESYIAVKETLEEYGFNYGNLYDYAENAEENRNIITIIQVFSYGFIVLISLIAAANVFNTVSTNISLRRREFAMLKSVGMTSKGFNRMMNFECLLYGSRALLYGLPMSTGITYLIYLAVGQGFVTEFRLPWTAIGVAVLSVFVVVFATMIYSMSKVKEENPIDALKNENL